MGIAMWDRDGAGDVVEDELCVHNREGSIRTSHLTLSAQRWWWKSGRQIIIINTSYEKLMLFVAMPFFHLLLHFHLVAHFNLQEHGSSVHKHKPFPPTSQFIVVVVDVVVFFSTSCRKVPFSFFSILLTESYLRLRCAFNVSSSLFLIKGFFSFVFIAFWRIPIRLLLNKKMLMGRVFEKKLETFDANFKFIEPKVRKIPLTGRVTFHANLFRINKYLDYLF